MTTSSPKRSSGTRSGDKLVIGLTGGLASGKTTVARLLRNEGFPVIDADEIAREILRPGQRVFHCVKRKFGPSILTLSGEINRTKLGTIVFKHPNLRKRLEHLTHPEIIRRIRRRIAASQEPILIISAPLIYETKQEKLFDLIWAVYATRSQCIARAIKRNGMSGSQIRRRIQAQIPLKNKAQRADFVIQNTGTKRKLEKQVRDLAETLRLLSNTKMQKVRS